MKIMFQKRTWASVLRKYGCPNPRTGIKYVFLCNTMPVHHFWPACPGCLKCDIVRLNCSSNKWKNWRTKMSSTDFNIYQSYPLLIKGWEENEYISQMTELQDLAHKLRIHSVKMTTASKSGHPTSCSSMAEVNALKRLKTSFHRLAV